MRHLAAFEALLAPAVSILAERGIVAAPDAVQVFLRDSNGVGDDAALAVDALIKVTTYLFVAGWPGHTSERMQAYHRSRRLSEVLTEALAPALGVSVQHLDIPVAGGDVVAALRYFRWALSACLRCWLPTVLREPSLNFCWRC